MAVVDTCCGRGPAVRQTGTYPSARDERDLFRPLKRRVSDPNLKSSYQTHLVLETRAGSAYHHPKGQDGYRRICSWYPTSRTSSGLDSSQSDSPMCSESLGVGPFAHQGAIYL